MRRQSCVNHRSAARRTLGVAALWMALLPAGTALAGKGSEPLYQDPFDLAAGGASITRASKDGRLYANPALLPVGGAFHRWLGLTTTLFVNRESIQTVRDLYEQSRAADSGDSGADGESGGAEADSGAGDLVEAVLDQPVSLGANLSLSWVTSNFGFGLFNRVEPDVRARRIGEYGFPEATLMVESYHGAALGSAFRVPGFRPLSFGVLAKYVLAAEPKETISIDGPDALARFEEPGYLQKQVTHNRGVGGDIGMNLLFQGAWLDYTLGATVQDVGGTALVGEGETVTELKQVVSAGTGLTLHTGADAIHLEIDYRDLTGVYEEELFKRVHAGAKVMIRTYLGLATGLYHGYPTYGLELDLIFFRLAATAYTRELGDHAGADPRHYYMFSLSSGF